MSNVIIEVKLGSEALLKRITASDFEIDANNNLVIELASGGGMVCYAAGQWLGFTLKKEENTNDS